MPKVYSDKNVYDSCRDRISKTFDDFERIYVSFSAGKDSTVMLHMVCEEAKKRGRKVGIMLVDLEGQYKLTINHAEECFKEYESISERFWICLPLHLRNAVSVYQPHWKCWDKEAEKIWIRNMPKNCISDTEFFNFFKDGMEFEEFVPKFGEWYSQGKKTACFVGIRSDESLNRYRTIASSSKIRHNGHCWTTKVTENVYNIYPIYDWATHDIWKYHSKHTEKRYNELYDRMHLAGLTIHQMRICQPYGDDQRRGLWLFHIIEPETWAKVVARVSGANSGATYIGETGNINGYRSISKPDGHTWESFSKMLLESMPEKTKIHFDAKIYQFISWYKTRGYEKGIPDEAPRELEAKRNVPSWRRICKSLLRNDYWCKGLSFTQHKSHAYQKYLDLIARRKLNESSKELEVSIED